MQQACDVPHLLMLLRILVLEMERGFCLTGRMLLRRSLLLVPPHKVLQSGDAGAFLCLDRHWVCSRCQPPLLHSRGELLPRGWKSQRSFGNFGLSCLPAFFVLPHTSRILGIIDNDKAFGERTDFQLVAVL